MACVVFGCRNSRGSRPEGVSFHKYDVFLCVTKLYAHWFAGEFQICHLSALGSLTLGAGRNLCLQCCRSVSDPKLITKYPAAVLEVCTCKFGSYPQIQAFIKSDKPSRFPNLYIKYMRGLDPTVKLLDKEGRIKEILSISKWNTDTVQEFFETHLESQ